MESLRSAAMQAFTTRIDAPVAECVSDDGPEDGDRRLVLQHDSATVTVWIRRTSGASRSEVTVDSLQPGSSLDLWSGNALHETVTADSDGKGTFSNAPSGPTRVVVVPADGPDRIQSEWFLLA